MSTQTTDRLMTSADIQTKLEALSPEWYQWVIEQGLPRWYQVPWSGIAQRDLPESKQQELALIAAISQAEIKQLKADATLQTVMRAEYQALVKVTQEEADTTTPV